MIEIKLPKKIKVGGLTYKIHLDKKGQLQSDHNWGKTSAILQEVSLEVNATPERFSSCFIHELLHIADTVYLNDQLTEQQVSVLANGLHQALESMGVRFVK